MGRPPPLLGGTTSVSSGVRGGSGPDGAGPSKSERLAPSSVLKVAQGFFDFCHLFGRQHSHITDQFVVIKVGKTLNFAAGADSLTHRAQIVCGRT